MVGLKDDTSTEDELSKGVGHAGGMLKRSSGGNYLQQRDLQSPYIWPTYAYESARCSLYGRPHNPWCAQSTAHFGEVRCACSGRVGAKRTSVACGAKTTSIFGQTTLLVGSSRVVVLDWYLGTYLGRTRSGLTRRPEGPGRCCRPMVLILGGESPCNSCAREWA